MATSHDHNGTLACPRADVEGHCDLIFQPKTGPCISMVQSPVDFRPLVVPLRLTFIVGSDILQYATDIGILGAAPARPIAILHSKDTFLRTILSR